MTATGLPDGWKLITGTWGTDVDRNDSVNHSGNFSIELKNTSTAAKVVSPPFVLAGTLGVSSVNDHSYYVVSAWCRASGTNVQIKLTISYDGGATGTTILSGVTAPDANEWFLISEIVAFTTTPTATIASITIEKNTTAETVYVDTISVVKMPPFNGIGTTNSSTITSDGTWYDAPFSSNNEIYRNHEIEQSSGGVMTIHHAGMYMITATVKAGSDIAEGARMAIRLVITDASASETHWFEGTQATETSRSATVSLLYPLGYLDTVKVQLLSDEGPDRGIETNDVAGDMDVKSHFTIARIGRY